ncbi:Xaa-Pro dipeptidyl-peptidase [Streptomyces alfalfae]|uniref:Xaa-Pro dipeptidyl-peptidase n=1 Tax=Streptomyces alfalfae TaxID=1642299 RepID=A0ABM6GNG2_9ACTN|nr:Xaa-Pro dipeptidyl-peptidase [Streptomyces alfalfae]AYA15552.1 Xaa-Pro dipeptidyl-peptidase [Streptomyces fradiae]APY85209.1 Xaa-Pro dipeptidyl-peptidase [Streptomyces alfalfae]QUI34987.1 Xaa-Pro dipeptidyl-peptidase [Streptomyces alfalfae]RXX39028.1 Xaa-Pro dipeptidyl-peptidase [Streptomyces alfalfae]RZM94088.1 Xaa-Pro dipeptidyl-peptidase [Streptomyces alfalfae]
MPIRARRTRLLWRSLLTAALAALMATLMTPGAAQGAAGPRTPDESKPMYAYENAIRESVWVDTRLDGDADGRTDRVAVDIVRPRELDRTGRRIPVIMDASPYYACCGRGNESQKKTYDAQGNPVRFPLYYDNYFVPRGYGYVAVDLAGTNRSDGCVDVGGRSDVRSAKAVVDWLNGRARGYTSRTGQERAKASWSNGRTGMIGKSYDGTVAQGVAATGVKGLKTIVPIGAISSWYDYYFQQGAPLYDSGPEWLSDAVESPEARARCGAVRQRLIDGAPRSGDFTRLWSERDHVPDADKVRASVFVVHGMQDLNVRAKHFGQWWDALAENGVDRKIWLSQAGHVDPFDFRRADWVRTLHRWFDHELLGYDNGVDREPMADIERAPDRWTTDRVWPPRATETVTLRPAEGDAPGVGTLGTRRAKGTETFTDDPKLSETDWAERIDTPTPAKAGFVTRPLARDLRLSGSSTVTVTATPTTRTAHLSAVLVDLGPATIRDYAAPGEGITTLAERDCWGPSTTGDSSCYRQTRARTAAVEHTIFSRGWADLGTWADPHRGRPLTPGRPHTITVDLAASDHVVPKGHRLALIVAGTDKNLIEPPADTPALTIDLARTHAKVPLAGGASTFRTSASVIPRDTRLDGVAPPRPLTPVPGGSPS